MLTSRATSMRAAYWTSQLWLAALWSLFGSWLALADDGGMQRLLMAFNTEGGFMNSKLSFEFSDQLGWHATVVSPLEKEELLFSVPVSFLITPLHWEAKARTLGIEVLGATCEGEGCSAEALDDADLLTLQLLEERIAGSASKFAAYVDMLPANVGTPYFWEDSEIEAIQGTKAFDLFYRDHQYFNEVRLPRLRNAALVAGAGLADAAPLDFLWARANVKSRAFTVLNTRPRHQLDGRPFMAPVNDAINHSPRALGIVWHLGIPEDDSPVASVLSKQTLPEQSGAGSDAFRFVQEKTDGEFLDNQTGLQFFNHYDAMSNPQLLLGYGFALLENPDDELPLTFDLPVQQSPELEALRERKLHLLQLREVALPVQLTLRPHTVLEETPPELVPLLRVLLMDAAAVEAAVAKPLSEGSKASDYISEAVDASCHRVLFQQLHAMLQGIPGGHPDNKRKLLENGAVGHMRNALVARLGEKILISFLEQLARARLTKEGVFVPVQPAQSPKSEL